MDDKTKKYILIGAVVLVVLYFVWKNSQKGSQSQEDASMQQAASALSQDMPTIGTASERQRSEEDEEYQSLLRKYSELCGGKLPKGATDYSTNMLKDQIKAVEALQKAWLEYAKAEENESIQKDLATLMDSGVNTVALIQQLTSEVKARYQKERLKGLLDAFITTCNNYGYIMNPAGAKRQEWDTSTLIKIMALPDSDLKVLSNMVKERKNELDYPDNYSALKSRYYCRTSLYLAIPSGTLCSYRTGASVAQEFRKKMQSKGY